MFRLTPSPLVCRLRHQYNRNAFCISFLGLPQQITKNWVTQNQKFILTVWKPEIWNQGVGGAMLPLKKGEPFLASSYLPEVTSNPGCSSACRQALQSLAVSTWCSPDVLSVLVSYLPSSKDTSHWIRAHPSPVQALLTLVTFKKTVFAKMSRSQVPGDMNFEGHYSIEYNFSSL